MKSPILYIILYLFFFLTPMESISIIQGGHLSLPKLSVILLLLAFIMSQSFRRLQYNNFLGIFIIYLIWAFITSVFSINIDEALLRWLSFVVPMLILLYILNSLVNSDKIIRNIMYSFILGCCIPICIMINLMINGVTGDVERMTALSQDQNELSVMLCIAVSFVFILLKQNKSKLLNLFLVIFICLCLVAILLTGSRTGFIILLAVSLLGLLSYGKKGLVWIIITITLIIPFVLPLIPESNIERLLQTSEQLSDGNLTGRGDIWEQGLNAFKLQNPVRLFIGIGYDQFPFMYKQYYGIITAPHNTFLSSYIEQGIVGFIIFIYILTFILVRTFRLCRSHHTLVYLGMIVPVILAMLTLGLQTRRWLWILLFLIYKIYTIDRNIKINMN